MVHVTHPRPGHGSPARRALLPVSGPPGSYGGRVTSRGPLTLAALASAAVPGLDPDSVEGVVTPSVSPFDVAFVQDHDHRRWVVRAPRTPAASAQLEQSAALLALLARRLTMPVPAVKGWAALPEGGRACVSSYLTGRMVDVASIAPGSTLAAGLGRALAQLHNLDVRIYEEAGVPVYDAAAYRARRLAELDRAAATGRVPTGLLGRWEGILDDESLWGFTATPTHGAIGPGTILASPDDGDEPDVKGFLGWESAQVADPADDLAPLVGELHPEALDTVLEAYAHARVERPDKHLQRRARLVHEMQLVRTMMVAVAAGDDAGAERRAAELRRLDEQLAAEEEAERARLEAKGADRAASATAASGDATSATDDASADEARADKATAADGDADEQSAPAPAARSAQVRQPVATAAVAAQATADADPEDSDADAAVEVEPAPPAQPVAVAAPLDADGEGEGEGDDGQDHPQQDSDLQQDVGASEDSSGGADETAASLPEAPRRPGTDHATAEIVPINDEDDGDDIIPVHPRR